jgi:hypothetical protein
VRTNLISELQQDPLHFLAFLPLQLTNPVTSLDSRRRLDEQCSSGGRRIVHDSADRTLSTAPNRDDKATVAHCHRRVGDALVRLELGHCPLEQLDQLALRSLELAPNAS